VNEASHSYQPARSLARGRTVARVTLRAITACHRAPPPAAVTAPHPDVAQSARRPSPLQSPPGTCARTPPLFMPSPAPEPPALCIYCGALPSRDAARAGRPCTRCGRATRPDEVTWERTRPRAGESRLRGALFSFVVFAAALAMLARIVWVIRG